MTRFAWQAGAARGAAFASYAELHDWSVADPEAFWMQLWRFADLRASALPEVAVQCPERFPGAVWFPGAKLNYAENLLRRRDEGTALISYLENGARREIRWAELHSQAAALAAQLAQFGIRPGDRVAGWLPNGIEAIVAMLATVWLGGVWSSCSPDFGAEGALDRFGQIEPKLLFAADGYRYGGKAFDVRAKVLEVAAQTPSIERTIWVSLLGTEVEGPSFASLTASSPDGPQVPPFAQLGFNHPLFILYSSGTTGRPKCIVHSVGGALLQHLKEHQLHLDLGPEDRLFFFTTCGWMMWNWLASALATGCTVLLYDGSPLHPDAAALWKMAEREGVTAFGASAKYLSGIEKLGLKPGQSHNLGALRTLMSTGSTLAHESFRYVYRAIKEDLHLVSMTGGTDIISCFAGGNPNLPVHEGELQCKALGMAVDVWDVKGRPARGEKGELVCTRTFPSCPIGFWNDPQGKKFRAAYFEKFPGVWAHGDFAEITERGGFVMHGRSDAVLNPGGVRIGTAEIYRQVEQIEEVFDSVCVGQEWEGDTRVVLFIMLRPGIALGPGLVEKIKSRIRTHASPRHVPRKILAVPDVPRTMNGKIAELAVREAIHGRPVRNSAALANPESLEAFVALPELQS